MTTGKEQLEAEIAQRDARIAELEAQASDGTSGNAYRAELYDEVWQAARDMGYGNVTGALQALAALKAQQPSAGGADERVAFEKHRASGGLAAEFLERYETSGNYKYQEVQVSWETWQARAALSPAGGVVLPERMLDIPKCIDPFADGWNACLDEIARLNPCRAQAVPDVMFDGFAVYSALDAKAQGRTSPENVSDTLDAAVRLIRAAAPSAKKES